MLLPYCLGVSGRGGTHALFLRKIHGETLSGLCTPNAWTQGDFREGRGGAGERVDARRMDTELGTPFN